MNDDPRACTPLVPPRPVPILVDAYRAFARLVTGQLWEVTSFQLARRAIQHNWGPPPDWHAAISAALGTADPLMPSSICGVDDKGTLVEIQPQPWTQVTAFLARLANEHLTLAGFPEPTPRLRIWAVLGLLWPADSAGELAAILPIIPEIRLNRTTGAVTKMRDPVRAKVLNAETHYIAAWEEQLAKKHPPWPDLAWTARGRRSGSGIYSSSEVFLNDARSRVPTKPHERRAFTQPKLAKALGMDRATLKRYLLRFEVNFANDIRDFGITAP